MSALTTEQERYLDTAVASQRIGAEIAAVINGKSEKTSGVQGVIIATSTSTTTDFGVVAVGDVVVHIQVSAGDAVFAEAVTIGTCPITPVVGDLYIVLSQG